MSDKSQRLRKNRTKPYVAKLYEGGMWWAQVIDHEGTYYCRCFFNHADALAQAYEYARMSKEEAL